MVELKRILVPVDLSEASRAGLLQAARMAKSFGASVHVLYVWEAPVFIPSSTVVSVANGPSTPLGELVRQNAEGQLQAMIESIRPDKDLVIMKDIVFGEPARVIARAAQQADLVILGTRLRTGAHRSWIGSVAEAVLRTSPAPVLTVPFRHD